MSDLPFRSSQPAARRAPHRFSLLQGKVARRLVTGAGILLASLGFALVAASQGRPDRIAARLGFPVAASTSGALPPPAGRPISGQIKTPIGMVSLADLQRRGNSLVGEIKTPDGMVTRLVLDARTHSLIGMRIVNPAGQSAHPPHAVHEHHAIRACPDFSTIAPMPGTLQQ